MKHGLKSYRKKNNFKKKQMSELLGISLNEYEYLEKSKEGVVLLPSQFETLKDKINQADIADYDFRVTDEYSSSYLKQRSLYSQAKIKDFIYVYIMLVFIARVMVYLAEDALSIYYQVLYDMVNALIPLLTVILLMSQSRSFKEQYEIQLNEIKKSNKSKIAVALHKRHKHRNGFTYFTYKLLNIGKTNVFDLSILTGYKCDNHNTLVEHKVYNDDQGLDELMQSDKIILLSNAVLYVKFCVPNKKDINESLPINYLQLKFRDEYEYAGRIIEFNIDVTGLVLSNL